MSKKEEMAGKMYSDFRLKQEYAHWVRQQPVVFLQAVAAVAFFQGLGFCLTSLIDRTVMPLPQDPLVIIGTVYMLCGLMFLLINIFMQREFWRREKEEKDEEQNDRERKGWIHYRDPNPELSIFAGMENKETTKKTE